MDFTRIPLKSLLQFERANAGKNAFTFLRTLKDDTSASDLLWLAFFAKTAEDKTYTFAQTEDLSFGELMKIVNDSNTASSGSQ